MNCSEPDEESPGDVRLRVQTRHGPVDNAKLATVRHRGEGAFDVQLDTADRGLAPGQYAAFYTEDNRECLGAGVISENAACT